MSARKILRLEDRIQRELKVAGQASETRSELNYRTANRIYELLKGCGFYSVRYKYGNKNEKKN